MVHHNVLVDDWMPKLSLQFLLSEMLRDVAMLPTRFLETNEVALDVSGLMQRSISVLKVNSNNCNPRMTHHQPKMN
jgi:hypothetical protein